MKFTMESIGTAHTDAVDVPRHWTVSDVEGTLVIDRRYAQGLRDIRIGGRIVVIFAFHESPAYDPRFLLQKPKHLEKTMGVFSICSPKRPNPIGMSVLEVLSVADNTIRVKGIDMLDGTPILDIKPHHG